MRLPIYQVDAFASRQFAGNPAAVVPLESWLSDTRLQAIAAENNLSETAFFVGSGDEYELRWFTPSTEVDLCGHATLASAYVLFGPLGKPGGTVLFSTRSGGLAVSRDGNRLRMNFPACAPKPCDPLPGVTEALGAEPNEVHMARDVVCVFENEGAVRALEPDMVALAAVDVNAVIATAPGLGGVDFVSRFFAPAMGVPEDPVTGSAHCTLAPFWSERLGKDRLLARQVSARGGEILCEMLGDRVALSGEAVLYLEGTIIVSDEEA